MSNHGVVCAGKNLEEAFTVARTLEKACELFIETAKRKAS
jgi:ribulose-5-phosphate 4-epimerase/fuculose-1-phosphate aldolase